MFKMELMATTDPEDEFESVAMSAKDAREFLWSKLAVGELTATVVDAAGAVVQVPSHEWPYLALEADDRLMDRLVFANGSHAPAYDKVTIPRSAAPGIWDGYLEPPSPPLMSYLAGETTWSWSATRPSSPLTS
jgi:hypothetical protein